MENMAKNTAMTPELRLLWDLSKVLIQKYEPQKIVEVSLPVLKQHFGVKNLDILMFDPQSQTLKDFTKTWVFIDEKTQDDYLKTIFAPLKSAKSESFTLNGVLISFDLSEQEFLKRLKKCSRAKNNVLCLPLSSLNRVFGFMKLCLDKPDNGYVMYLALKVAAYQLSSVIVNSVLSEKMEKNGRFHEAMKNIAKIIESQYELAYIIPIIGEMIDRFVSEHLIYIFLKEEGKKYRLLWPGACHDKSIAGMLKEINIKKEYIASPDHKTVVFPLVGEQNLIGAIVAHSTIDRLSQKEIDYLVQLSKQSSTTIQRANVYGEILQYATLDALTGLNNRRQFEARLKQEISTAKRKNKPLCCFMIDVDYFKKVNDTYGHVAGDLVLKSVANIIKAEIREYDIASRYGGEEFSILLPFTTLEEANFVAQRLRKAVENTDFDISEANLDTKSIRLTISIGVSSFDSKTDNAQSLYQNADKALYDAKRLGRNRVIVSQKTS